MLIREILEKVSINKKYMIKMIIMKNNLMKKKKYMIRMIIKKKNFMK